MRCFSDGFQLIENQKRLIAALAEGLPWFHRFVPSILEIQMYIVEPGEPNAAMPGLRKVVSTVGNGSTVMWANPVICQQGDPEFYDRLMTSAVSAENVKEIVYEHK